MKKELNTAKKLNPFTHIAIVIIITMLGLELFSYLTSQQGERQTLSYNQFKNRLEQNSIKEIWIDKDKVVASVKVEMTSKPTYLKTTLPPFEDKTFLALLEKNQVDIHVKSQKESNFWLMFILLLPLFFFLGFMLYGTNRIKKQLGGMGGGPFDFMRSSAKQYDKKAISVTFDDVAGVENAKIELYEVVDFLKNPEKYERIGAKIPRGILLMGAPGTGKTLLAKAVAGEAEVPFFSISGSEFVEMFVGVGAARVRDLFKKAKKEAPAIIFIDEIDSVGRARGAGIGGGHDEKE